MECTCHTGCIWEEYFWTARPAVMSGRWVYIVVHMILRRRLLGKVVRLLYTIIGLYYLRSRRSRSLSITSFLYRNR